MVHALSKFKKAMAMVSGIATVLSLFLASASSVGARASFVNSTMTDGVVGQVYSFQFQASQGDPPYTFEKWYTTYPANDVILTGDGLVSGTPSVAGDWEWGIRLSDNTNSVYGVFTWKVSASGTTTNPTLTVSLAGTNPASATVNPGTADVPFTSLKLRATGNNVTVTALKVQTDSSSGAGISTVKVASSGSALGPVASLTGPDGNGIRSATITLSNPLVINKDTEKVVDVSGTLTSQATGSIRLGIGGVTSTTSPTPTISGVPQYGNTMTVSSTTSGITLTVSTPNTPTGTTIPATTDNYSFTSVRLQATGGTVNITGLRLVSDSTIASNITNLKLYKNNSELVGVATNLSYTDGSTKYAPIVFSSPIVVTTSAPITLDIRASLASAPAGTVRLGISNLQFSSTSPTVSGSLPAYGNSFTVSGSSTTAPQVAITRDTSYPSTLNVTAGQTDVNLFGLKVLASQADAQLSALYVGVNSTTELSKLANWRLVYSGGTIAGIGPVSVGTNPNAIQFIFPTPLTLQKTVQQTMRVVADIPSGVTGTVQPKLLSSIVRDTSGNQLTTGVTTESFTTQVTINTSSGSLQITSPTALPEGTAGQPYSYKFAATGGTAPYTWTLAPRSFNAYRCCFISLASDGTFASTAGSDGRHMPDSGSYEIAAKVTDGAGRTAEKLMTYVIRPAGGSTGAAKEGFIDFVSGTQISGWAFDNNTLPKIIFTFQNVATGQQYTTDTYPTTSISRPDVVSHLSSKYNLVVTVPVAYTINPSTIVPNGTYVIIGSTYNGKTFNSNATSAIRFTVGGPSTNPAQYANQYVQVEGDSTVYYVVGWGGKMPILSAQVFYSYGGRWENILTIPQEALDDMDDVMYIKQRGNARVYKIENGIKYYLTPQAASRLNVDPARVVEVNKTEFLSYRTGRSIQ